MDPNIDAVSHQNEATSQDMATAMDLFAPRTKRTRDKRDRYALVQLAPFNERILYAFVDIVVECQRNEIVVEALQRQCLGAETALQQVEAEIDAFALRHLPDAEDAVERFQRIYPRLSELGAFDLEARWNTAMDAAHKLTELRDQEEQDRQACRGYVDAHVQRLIDDRLEVARVQAKRHLKTIHDVDVGSASPPRPSDPESGESIGDGEGSIAARGRFAKRYYEADYQLQKARLDHDGLRNLDGDRFAEWQRRRADTSNSDERDALWAEITATAIRDLR